MENICPWPFQLLVKSISKHYNIMDIICLETEKALCSLSKNEANSTLGNKGKWLCAVFFLRSLYG
jgi:hypothetical protein